MTEEQIKSDACVEATEEHVIPGTSAEIVDAEPNILKTDFPFSQKENQFSLAVCALRKLQLETKAIDSEFFARIYEMETEYQTKHDAVFKRRYEIVNGDYIPNETECALPGSETAQSAENNVGLQENNEPTISGLPRFWRNILNSTILKLEIQKGDGPILDHLTDICSRNRPLPELGFNLEFHFSPNEYFENSVLTKEYFYTCSYGNPFVHEGPEIYKSVGCEIKWKDGKAPSNPSFFDYFSSNKTLSTAPNTANEIERGMDNDFEMGYFIKQRIIPRAVLYFTGDTGDDIFDIANCSETNTVVGSDEDDACQCADQFGDHEDEADECKNIE